MPRSAACSSATYSVTWATHVVLLAASSVNVLTLVRYNYNNNNNNKMS